MAQGLGLQSLSLSSAYTLCNPQQYSAFHVPVPSCISASLGGGLGRLYALTSVAQVDLGLYLEKGKDINGN